MRKSTRTLLVIASILIIAIVIVIVFVVIPRDSGLRVKDIAEGGITVETVKDFEKSRLHLYDNGTFTIEIVYIDEVRFSAVGSYEKGDKSYNFTYFDCWTRTTSGGITEIIPNYNFKLGATITYELDSKKRIMFNDHLGNRYFFG